jgi:ornithine cyclodeaminase/alanine dehydrogenase-like protein (mu-crystallin family)
VLPRLRRVLAFSRTAASAARFAEEARGEGLAADAVAEARRAVEDVDIVVTSVPQTPEGKPFLDPAWLARGAFVSAVDLGRSWAKEAIGHLDLIATDEHEQSRLLGASGKLAYPGPFHADLAELATGAGRHRTDPGQRAMFIFAGHSLGDLAAAQAVLEAAQRQGIGTRLPL